MMTPSIEIMVRNFYNLAFARYNNRNYALVVTAMHFSIHRDDIERLGI